MRFVRSFCFNLMVFVAAVAYAQSNPYVGEVPVPDQSDVQRNEGLKNALAQVVMKLTGDSGVLANEAVAKAVGEASRFVQQYSYRQTVAPDNGQPQVRLSLVAQFDRIAIDRLLGDFGLKIQSASRPVVVAWLALDDGSGPRLLDKAESSSLLRDAQRRGINLVLPTVIEPSQTPTVQTVWQGDLASLAEASARYQTSLLLIGQLRRLGEQWVAHWSFANDAASQSWDASGPDLGSVFSAGAYGAAERLADRYSLATLERKITQTRVWVSNLGSALDYARLLEALSRDSLVREAQPMQARGDGVLFQLTLNVTLDGWLESLPADGPLHVVSAKPPLEGIQATLSFAR